MAVRGLIFLIILLAALPFGSARPIWQWIWVILIAVTGLCSVFSIWIHRSEPFKTSNSLTLIWPQFRLPLSFSLIMIVLLYSLAIFNTIPASFFGQQITPDSSKSIATATYFTAHFLLFWMIVVGTTCTRHAIFFLKAIAVICAIYAAYGIGAHVLDGQHVLWFKKTSSWGSLTSTFINRNSYATFSGLGMLSALAVFFDSLTRTARYKHPTHLLLWRIKEFFSGNLWLYFLCFVLLTTSLLLSGSRGGVLAAMVAVGTLTFLSFPIENRKLTLAVFGILILTIVTGLALSGDFLLDRLSSGINSESRTVIYSAIIENWTSSHLFGLGLGHFEDLFPLYRPESLYQPIIRAHNDYLEFAYTAGVVSLILLLIPIWILVRVLYIATASNSPNQAFFSLGIASTVLVAVHSLVDFSLQIPAVSYIYVIILGLTSSLRLKSAGK